MPPAAANAPDCRRRQIPTTTRGEHHRRYTGAACRVLLAQDPPLTGGAAVRHVLHAGHTCLLVRPQCFRHSGNPRRRRHRCRPATASCAGEQQRALRCPRNSGQNHRDARRRHLQRQRTHVPGRLRPHPRSCCTGRGPGTGPALGNSRVPFRCAAPCPWSHHAAAAAALTHTAFHQPNVEPDIRVPPMPPQGKHAERFPSCQLQHR
ncbi:hypothetical protein SAMN04489742_3679 [Arthrobacter crystallopoietes]|uniref:Uncharacterized protein n=1 Tax=Crystallibacter crystallopoietes TaxID=37928 RepID=A0A1H1FVI4_9MICC|nr:hypothetical protein SAMN04489742_3679 [Arthrobacter crystallopoietes]